MKHPAIYVDFDDVLSQTALALAGLLEREFGKTVAFDDIHAFNLSESFGIDAGELQHLMELGHQSDFLAGFEPVPGARAGLAHWAEQGYAVEIVTGRPAATFAASKDWLERHDMPFADLVFVDKYSRTLMPEGADRALTLDALYARDYVLAVEDAPHMAGLLLAHMTMPVAVMDRPWNLKHPIAEGPARERLFRCRDWAALTARFPAP